MCTVPGADLSQVSPYPSLGPAGTGAEGLWPPLGLVVLGEFWPHSPSPLARTPQLPTCGQAPAPQRCPQLPRPCHHPPLPRAVHAGGTLSGAQPLRASHASASPSWAVHQVAVAAPTGGPSSPTQPAPPRSADQGLRCRPSPHGTGRSLSQTQCVCVLIPLDLTHEVGSSPPGRRGRGLPSRTPAGLCARPLPRLAPAPANRQRPQGATGVSPGVVRATQRAQESYSRRQPGALRPGLPLPRGPRSLQTGARTSGGRQGPSCLRGDRVSAASGRTPRGRVGRARTCSGVSSVPVGGIFIGTAKGQLKFYMTLYEDGCFFQLLRRKRA